MKTLTFAEILRETTERKIEDFNGKIIDEVSLKNAFNYITKIIGIMSSLFVEINDITGYKSLFESENSPQEDIEFITTVNNIEICGSKVKQVTNMIYEYLYKGTVNDRGIEKRFNPSQTPILVNNSTHQAQTAVRDYKGQQSIENSCQVYDLTVDVFNSTINVMNELRNLDVPKAEYSNLVIIVKEKNDK
jgi:hypothetical protein